MMNNRNKHAYKMQHWKRQLFYFNCGVFSLLSTHIGLLDFLPFFFEHSPIFPQDITSSPSSSSANTWNCVPRALPSHGPKLAGVGVSEPSTLLPSVKMYIFTFQIFQAKKCALSLIISSVRSSNSHPDLLLTQHHHHPLFQITPVLNTGLSLSEPLQLYQGQSLDSSAGYMYTLCARYCKIVQGSAR